MRLRTLYDKFLKYRIVNNEDARLFEVMQWRAEGGFGGFNPPRNSEGPPKSCQTQTDCENC